MNQGLFLLVPVLLPILTGILIPLLPPLQNRRKLRVYFAAALLLEFAAALVAALRPDSRLVFLRLGQGLPLSLESDLAAKCFCVLATAMFLLAGIFACQYMKHEENEQRFSLFYLCALGMVVGLGLAGNLLTLYLFFECMTLLTVPLVLHSMTKQSIAAAFQYLFYSIAGASMALIGLFFIYRYGDIAAFSPGGGLDPAKLAGSETAMLAASLLTIVGFSTKAGMFPMHAWLPAAHPVAPAPASAILSGVITKSGVFAVFRYVFYTVGPDFLRGSWAQTVWLILILISILMGSTLAFKEPLLKKRFAYSSISQVSYILLGIATLSPHGVLGGLLHILFHSVTKNGLFLCAGAILYKTGKTYVYQLRGLGREMPATLTCFSFFALTAVGIPPTSGFVSKWYLATGALESDLGVFRWLGPAVLLLSALLTAGYLFPIVINGFFPGEETQATATKNDPGLLMLGPLAVLAVLAVGLGLFPGGVMGLLQQIVAEILP